MLLQGHMNSKINRVHFSTYKLLLFRFFKSNNLHQKRVIASKYSETSNNSWVPLPFLPITPVEWDSSTYKIALNLFAKLTILSNGDNHHPY